LAGLAAAAVGGCGRRAGHRVLRLGHGLDPGHPVHLAMEKMAEAVRERSAGRMEIKIYPSSLLGSEREMIELLQLGAVDLVKTSTAPLEGFVPGMAVFGIPYVFRDENHYWRVLDGPVGREILDLGTDKKLKGLCFYDAGSRSFYTRDRPVRSPADLRGLKIRVQNSRAAILLVEAMGAAATPIAFGELYSALDQGVVDGAENNPPSVLTSGHHEVCKFYCLDEHTRVPDIVLVGTETWGRLTPDERRWLQGAADESAGFQREVWGRQTEEALGELSAAGVEVSRPDPLPFQEAVRDLHGSYRGTEASRWMERALAEP
jgi:tripartite ATP-independent transporter DctP family solute receptor